MASLRGDAYLAATLITFGAITDGLDGAVARWLDAISVFGIWFDYFSDYVCYVVAPWILCRSLLEGPTTIYEIALAMPLVTAAVRYARNGARLAAAGPGVPDLPGLGTVFTAFVPVTTVFLGAELPLRDAHAAIVAGSIVVFALLMNTRVRFPKLTKLKGASPLVLVLLALEPFWMTKAIAAATVVIGVSYVLLAARLPRARGAAGSQTSSTRAAM